MWRGTASDALGHCQIRFRVEHVADELVLRRGRSAVPHRMARQPRANEMICPFVRLHSGPV
eukprot:6655549-Prymnesium_polylepis.1